ncbi:acylphosphatase [Reichenbachiella ulvae]|uniref:acylphosphatase n=1 Tax=Reichenbachiella ulvae TaxID=2980104 RepID=A0ABT3CTJ2_9BACT|nr:acylphosphatase [Reichenbachiella ulvae]MCV9386917.1 acylphosphatase [Reichenbachiella ulvae]
MSENIGKSIIVRGKVQGVFYRASTLEKAEDLGLKGWVKNLPDGTVQLEVHGGLPEVTELHIWCSTGSEFSEVKEVDAVDIPFNPDLKDFRITY